MKRLLTTLVILLSSLGLSASHLLGGEIWWDCQPNGQYVFYLRLYRDCTGIPLGAAGSINSNSPAGSIPVTLVSGYPKDVSPSGPNCTGSLDINCNNPTTGAVEEHLFKSNPVTLNGVPPAAGWNFTWTSCARPGGMANINGGCYFLRAFMFPYNPGTGNLNANPCYDNSPEFLEAPKVTTCAGYPFAFNNFAFDNELDSLYFDWAQPLDNSLTSAVTFTGGYTFNNPVPGIESFSQDAGQVTINTQLTGKYATCMRVSAFKCGQKVAEIYRDIPIILLACTGGVGGGGTNDPPSLDVINDPLPAPQLLPVVQSGDTLYYEMTVRAGDSIYFRMQSADNDFTPGFSPQQIKFVGVGGNLGQPLNNPSNCLFNPPCATIRPIAPQTGFTTALTNNVEFSWKTECNHLSYNPNACGAARSQYLFYFKMEDNYCPAPSFKLITARINVVSPQPVAPSMANACISVNPDSSVTFDWGIPVPGDTAQNFDYYVIYRGGNGVPFTELDTVFDYSTNNYTDMSPLAGNNYYFVRTFGGCSQFSFPSDTLSVINLNISPFPATSPYRADLSWNSPRVHGFNGTYQVWRQNQMIATTTDTFYQDYVDLCGDFLDYQIRIDSSCNSTEASGYFADQINNDSLPLFYATVDNGQAVIDFPSTPHGDVLNYLLLQRLPGIGWQTVDTIAVGTPTPYTIPSSIAGTTPETYKVVSLDSCMNQSSDLIVPAHTTMYLEGDLNPCEARMRLEWNNYQGWEVDRYYIMADVTPPGGPMNQGVIIGTNLGDDTTFVHENLQSGAIYCYYIMAIDTSLNDTSISSEYCINSSVVVGSQLSYLARATVRNDESVEVWAFIDGNADVDEFQIQRAEDELGPWVTLGIVPMPAAAPFEIRYTDFSANTNSSRYIYRIRTLNQCGGLDTISNYGTNILLEVSTNENLTNQLRWNRYRDFGGNTTYSVFRRPNENAQWNEIETGITDTNYTDNIRQFAQGNGVFCYKVVAVESNNPLGFLDETGAPMQSHSNQACVDHDSRGFYPNAFNPNSAVPENRVWRPQMLFEKDSEYSVSIVDRWGNEVFKSDDPEEGWDGTFRGQDSPEAVYFFVVKYRSVEGKLKEDRGTITLLR
ncbi:MAG: gliding motility-associated C-terminal domain-containing protein [Flavobacteriia bacterium]|nr:gliding motility-associated C-terminal domain-containing protein [Flavobacteriia bacterium]